MKLKKRKLKFAAIFGISWFTLLVLLVDGILKFQTLVDYFGSYATTGFELGVLPHISDVSKLIITLNMLFGRVGMFTFMLIFIRQREISPIRLPETRLPLN